MVKKYEEISPQFFDLIFEAMAKGFFIEAICLILQFTEYGFFFFFLLEFSKKYKGKDLKTEFKEEISIAEKNSSFLIFMLFSNGLIDHELYRAYLDLKKTRNKLVHSLVKKTRVEYDKQKLRAQIEYFLKKYSVFVEKIKIHKKVEQ